ncbi:unnamed protein product [Prorocentrum cordatum]|uniref:2Fe-2S ferredoxin-type domain-containing protein n=1 Tax=Prorocentrum cordatum TaxID=2364126 RepID=A0ABN9QYB6_9DINO|nr:unnamed protein product [Polarella glacialis]
MRRALSGSLSAAGAASPRPRLAHRRERLSLAPRLRPSLEQRPLVPPSAPSQRARGSRWHSGGAASAPQLTRREQDRLAARAFIVERGYTPEVAEGVVAALSAPGSGVSPGGLLDMVKMMGGRPEIGEDAGLDPLAKSVELELARQRGREVIHFTFVPPGGGDPIACEGLAGMSLKDVAEYGDGDGARVLAEFLECACSGVMACSTCQVYVHPRWSAKVGEPGDAEVDMLELAHEPRDSSRLGCQLKLAPELEGLQIEIPGGANNMFDDLTSHKVVVERT